MARLNRLFGLLGVLLVVITTRAAHAEPGPDSSGGHPDPVTIELLTMGPGEHPFFKFGHNAIRILDRRDGTDLVYNFGTFSFDSPTLIMDFFKGRLNYWLSVEGFAPTVRQYRAERRSLVAQRLALSPQAKLGLADALSTNALPEHRLYKYDYFFDNCSTRLRDAIDTATQGQLRAALRERASQSLRDHALRATCDYFLEYLVLYIGLGPLVDQPTDRWSEAFLPEMLTEGLRRTRVRAVDGTTHPLVQTERIVLSHPNTRPARPPQWGWRFFAAGAFTGLLWIGLRYAARRHLSARVAFSVLLGAGGFVCGLMGCALLSLWLFTDHAVAFRNQNTLLFFPPALLLPWYAVRAMLGRAEGATRLRYLAIVLVSSASLALAIKLVPLGQQDNGNLLAFFLPCWMGLLVSCSKPVINGIATAAH